MFWILYNTFSSYNYKNIVTIRIVICIGAEFTSLRRKAPTKTMSVGPCYSVVQILYYIYTSM